MRIPNAWESARVRPMTGPRIGPPISLELVWCKTLNVFQKIQGQISSGNSHIDNFDLLPTTIVSLVPRAGVYRAGASVPSPKISCGIYLLPTVKISIVVQFVASSNHVRNLRLSLVSCPWPPVTHLHGGALKDPAIQHFHKPQQLTSWQSSRRPEVQANCASSVQGVSIRQSWSR
jgi:hypothetical protein